MRPIKVINEIEHSIKEPYDRSHGQIKQITDLCDKLSSKTGKDIKFDNARGFNHYVLIVDGQEYDFNLYRDVIAALTLLERLL